jgi:hypothetical protein
MVILVCPFLILPPVRGVSSGLTFYFLLRMPNAGHEPLPEAGAERTLAVGDSRARFGGVALDDPRTAVPTWPYWAT